MQDQSKTNGEHNQDSAADRQTNLTLYNRSTGLAAATPPASPPSGDGPPRRKRGRPPKHLAQPAANAVEAMQMRLSKLQSEQQQLKAAIAAEEKRQAARQIEIVGRVVIAASQANGSAAEFVRVLLQNAHLSGAERADLAGLFRARRGGSTSNGS